MSSSARRAAAARAQHQRAERMRLAERRRTRTRLAVGSLLTLVGVLAVMVIVRIVQPTEPVASASPAQAADAVAVRSLNIPAALLDEVGRGSTESSPSRIQSSTPLNQDGHPLVLYVGAEYCPFCAAQRWALVIALNRFGAFTDLGPARSASDDAYPDTATVTFYGATYRSDYLAFQAVELATSERVDGHYQPLQTLSAEQERLVRTFNAPPYVPASSAGAVPFVDFGNRYVMTGSTFSPSVLAGLSQQQIVAALSQADHKVSQAVLGSANAITATLCDLTGQQPKTVCASPAVTAFSGADRG